jgi:hypothetical protein
LKELLHILKNFKKEFHRYNGSLIHTFDDYLAKKYIAELFWKDCFNPYFPGVLLSQAKLEIDVRLSKLNYGNP